MMSEWVPHLRNRGCGWIRVDLVCVCPAWLAKTVALAVAMLCSCTPALAVETRDPNAPPPRTINVDEAVRLLNEGGPFDRAMVAMALRHGNREVMGLLLDMLDEESGVVRRAALLSLGELRCRGAVAAVGGQLRDEDTDVRDLAAKALGKIGGSQAVAYLLEGIEAAAPDDGDFVSVALEALDEMGAPEASEVAMSLVRHRAGQVREAALGILGNRRHFEAMSEMLRGLDDVDDDVRAAAIVSLQRTVPEAQGNWDNVTELVKWLDSSSAQRRQYVRKR